MSSVKVRGGNGLYAVVLVMVSQMVLRWRPCHGGLAPVR
jgi:hypothetical protein